MDSMLSTMTDRVASVLYPPEATARTLNVFDDNLQATRQLFEGGLVPTDDELRWREVTQ